MLNYLAVILLKVLTADFKSRIEDTDYAEATVDLQIAENMYQAALNVTANMLNYSLVNFLN